MEKLIELITEIVDLRLIQHIAEKHTRKKRAVKPKVPMPTKSFERFWDEYPRSDDKAGAMKEWAKLDGELFYTIIAAVNAQKRKGGRLADKQYSPHARKWLRNKGWMDPVETVRDPEQNRRKNREIYLQKERERMAQDTLWLLDIGVDQETRDSRLEDYKRRYPIRAKMFLEAGKGS